MLGIDKIPVVRDGERTHMCDEGLYIKNNSNRERMEEIIRAHKLESLGVLAGGIAHDFNNLMAIVMGYIYLALIDLSPEHASRQLLLGAISSIEQTKDLTSRLITFSQGGAPHRKISNIPEIIQKAVSHALKSADIGVDFDFTDDIWSAEVDEYQIRQCFHNITTNAVEAMPEGGKLTISTVNTLLNDDQGLDLKEGAYLKITFADEGIGIPEESLGKVFDPYFTTKEMGSHKGVGLGLAVCYSVLRKHDGYITVESQQGEGTTFILYLPARMDL